MVGRLLCFPPCIHPFINIYVYVSSPFIPTHTLLHSTLVFHHLPINTKKTQQEIVISVPLNAILSVHTTVDHDPVLSRLLGPKARQQHGWDDPYYEVAILTVAVLYHRNLGDSSPLLQYLRILQSESTTSMPVLWTKDRLRQDASDGVRSIARAIQKDVKEMYQTVVKQLQKDHPNVFVSNSDAYSLRMFQWAFALVNSRHWHLSIPDLDTDTGRGDDYYYYYHTVIPKTRQKSEYTTTTAQQQQQQQRPPNPRDEGHGPSVGEQVPPADQPTEEWVREQSDTGIDEREDTAEMDSQQQLDPSRHSFLAPVADLLNFGPPCTRGFFNHDTQTFQVIATCSFRKGQEVTYWYSDDCDDVIISNYGFTHPLVPSCSSQDDDWMDREEYWQRKVESLEAEVQSAYQDLDQLNRELVWIHEQLDDCDCQDKVDRAGKKKSNNRSKPRTGDGTEANGSKLDSDTGNDVGVRGSHHQDKRHAKWMGKSNKYDDSDDGNDDRGL